MANIKCVSCNKEFEHNARGRRPGKCPDCRGEKAPEPVKVSLPLPAATAVAAPVAPLPNTNWQPKTPENVPVSEFFKRCEARREAMKAKVAEQLRAAGDPKPKPYDPETIVGETVVEGKTVNEWADIRAALIDKSVEGGEIVLDMTQSLPGWVSVALADWHRRGCPTERGVLKAKIKEVTEQAEAKMKYAHLDLDKAAKLEEFGKTDKAAKLREAAAKKKEQAEALFQEAKQTVKEAACSATHHQIGIDCDVCGARRSSREGK